MTTKLESVIKEEWSTYIDPHFGGDINCAELTTPDTTPWRPDKGIRAAVAVLGKRALALALDAEKYGSICRDERCPARLGKPHDPDCEWGRIVEEARRLG